MMHFLRVIYYQSYLFYKKGWTSITKYDDVSLTTFFSVSSLVGLPLGLIGLIGVVIIETSNGNNPVSNLGLWVYIGIYFSTQIIMRYLLYSNGKWKRIISEKPVLFNNHKISAWLTIVCYLFVLLFILTVIIIGSMYYKVAKF